MPIDIAAIRAKAAQMRAQQAAGAPVSQTQSTTQAGYPSSSQYTNQGYPSAQSGQATQFNPQPPAPSYNQTSTSVGGAADAGGADSLEPKVLTLLPDITDRKAAAQQLLPGREYWIATDSSGSMSYPDVQKGNNKITRWQAVAERAVGLTQTAERYDTNGLTWIDFANDVKVKDNVKASEILAGFKRSPYGATALRRALETFRTRVISEFRKGNTKPHSLLIFTDGTPSPESRTVPGKSNPNDAELNDYARYLVKQEIIKLAKELQALGKTDEDVAISFLQVGDDLKTAEFLSELDDGLKADLGDFDIVDTKHVALVDAYNLSDEDIWLDGIVN